eukprot:753214-Hanusia_phi.AAC.4
MGCFTLSLPAMIVCAGDDRADAVPQACGASALSCSLRSKDGNASSMCRGRTGWEEGQANGCILGGCMSTTCTVYTLIFALRLSPAPPSQHLPSPPPLSFRLPPRSDLQHLFSPGL